jgi:hypothetical protein
MDERPDPENIIETAFNSSEKPREFLGKELSNFTSRRVFASQSIGMKLFSLSPAQLASLQAIGTEEGGALYEGAFMDAATVVWLCTLKDKDVVRASLSKEWSTEQILDWVDANGISPFNKLGVQLMEIFAEQVEAINHSTSSDRNAQLGKRELSPAGAST